jgi:hypothetical protein
MLAKDLLDGFRLLKDGGPGAVIGLLVGLYFTYPHDCGNALSGVKMCSNRVGQHFEAVHGVPLTAEWIVPLVLFIGAGGILIGGGISVARSR